MWYREPFFQVALPIIITFALATWHNNKRLDEISKRIDDLRADLGKRIDDLRADMIRRFDEVNKRLDRLEDRAGILKP
jgi:tetrahydromethanopterin S-methyltransferase subunit G